MYDPTKPYKSQIVELIKTTWEGRYAWVEEGLVYRREEISDFPEYSHTDGIGTKGVYPWRKRIFGNAVIDALAMNLNDLLLKRATAFEAVDHLFIPEDDASAIIETISHLTDECRIRGIVIPGGETAIHNNMEGMEISLCVRGFVRDPRPNRFQPDDILIGIGSNGLHASGFTKVRELFDGQFREEFIAPTAIYYDAVRELDEIAHIHGMTHITGGAFTKLREFLDGCDAIIEYDHDLEPQAIFHEIANRYDVSDTEMYRTFNCGIGFILGVRTDIVDGCVTYLRRRFQCADVIGYVRNGGGRIRIASKFFGRDIFI